MSNTTNRAYHAFLSSFVELLVQKPFAEITVHDIIVRSTYSRSSFYKYFKDKYELAQTLVDETAKGYLDVMMKELLQTEETPSEDDRLYQIALTTFQFVFRKKEVFQLIFSAKLAQFDLNYFCRKTMAYFKENEAVGAEVRENKVDLEFYYYCTTWQFVHYISFWQRSNFSQSPEYLAEQVVKITSLTKPGDVFDVKELKQ